MLAGTQKIHIEVRAHWGHSSAPQTGRELVDSDGEAMGLISFVDEVPHQCDICRAFEQAPYLPIAGTLTASSFNAKLQVGLRFLDHAIGFHGADLYSENSLLIPAHFKNPSVERDACCSSRIAIVGGPISIQIDEGGEWGSGIRTDSRTGRRIKLRFQGLGARPWLLERCSGLRAASAIAWRRAKGVRANKYSLTYRTAWISF